MADTDITSATVAFLVAPASECFVYVQF